MPHTWYRRGQKVLVVMKNGDRYVERFVEKKNGVMIFEGGLKIKVKEVRMTTIYRGER